MNSIDQNSQQLKSKINLTPIINDESGPRPDLAGKIFDNGEIRKNRGAPSVKSNFLEERIRFLFSPKTEEEQIKYDFSRKQATEQKQRDDEKLKGPLSTYHLSELTIKEFCFDGINKKNRQAFIHDIFFTLENNTEKFASKWELITNAYKVNIKKNPDENPAVICRFSDIPLVRSTAIPDAARQNMFLHANIVDLGVGRKFIATQRPLACEIPGFWKAVDKNSVSLIVDLTNKTDATRESDWQSYCPTWPLAQKKLSDISVSEKGALNSIVHSKFLKRNIKQKSLVIKSATTLHSLERIKFGHWPDGNVVEPEVLVNLANHAESLTKNKEGPILIHCRAGVGRTGSLMSFMAAREILTREKESSGRAPDFEAIIRTALEVVAKGRIARGPCFVQTKEQFELIIKALELHFSESLDSAGPSQPDALARSGAVGAGAVRQRNLVQERRERQKNVTRPKVVLPAIMEEVEPNFAPSTSRATHSDDGAGRQATDGSSMLPASAPDIAKNSQDHFATTHVTSLQSKASGLWQGLKKIFSEKKLSSSILASLMTTEQIYVAPGSLPSRYTWREGQKRSMRTMCGFRGPLRLQRQAQQQ